MTYKTVFDAAHQGHAAFAFPAFGLVFIAIGVLLLTKPKLLQQIIPNGRRSILTPGFHNTASHGGPIKPGLHVRLSYAGNDILRIEVAEWPFALLFRRRRAQPRDQVIEV
jgi:hypothetical protein